MVFFNYPSLFIWSVDTPLSEDQTLVESSTIAQKSLRNFQVNSHLSPHIQNKNPANNRFFRFHSTVGSRALQSSKIRELAISQNFSQFQTWSNKYQTIQNLSPFSKIKGWNIKGFIVKSGDDILKEMLAMQLIRQFKNIFDLEKVDIKLRPYRILATSANEGLIECIIDAASIDSLKKSLLHLEGSQNKEIKKDVEDLKTVSLTDCFEFQFGESYSPLYAQALINFAKSLAGYSLVTYLFQLRDRHNGNILLDENGHIIHVDFGFIMGDSPGFNMHFDSAPFKLTSEYIDLMGGLNGSVYKLFVDLFISGYFALQKQADVLAAIIQVGMIIANLIFFRRFMEVVDLMLLKHLKPGYVLHHLEMTY